MVLSLLNTFAKKLSSIKSTIRYVEWTLFAGFAALILLNHHTDGLIGLKILIFCALVGLSFIFPNNYPLWQRRTYIATYIALLVLGRLLGWSFGILLYLTIVKSCFLLSKREVAIVAFMGWIGWLLPMIWLVPTLTTTKERIMIYESISHSTVTVFVVLVGFLVVREQISQQQIRSLNQEVENLGTLLERSRIARNIHDTLGHSLTTLGIQLEIAQQIHWSHPEKTAERLNTAKQLTDQCLQDIREVVQTLRESDFDLNQGLTGLVTHLQQTHALTARVQLQLPPLTLQISYQIYCIIQEGITNIQKHSQASCVSLQTEVNNEFLSIELTDNGNGFDLAQSSGGFGLQGMYERLQLIGGSLNIQTAIGKGTRLLIMIPYLPESLLS